MAKSLGEKVFLVGVFNRATPRALAEEHLDELERLVETAGGRTAGRYVKDRAAPDPATYIGKGQVEEIGDAARRARVGLVVFDDDLTPAQARNIEERWGGDVRVLDRPGLILDVFALHARTREARIQVELAQLQYLLPRLAGQYGHLSGLGGGIGGRGGAGEQKLELDRRKIRIRISRLRHDLTQIETARAVRRRGRRDQFQVAIAGYTNAGKTTLFNRLTREEAYAADRLFATLDARVARARSGKLRDTVFIDTVGFVRKLPTSLVASFRSTLSEIRDADLVLHVLDGSSPRVEEERRVAVEVLEELGVESDRIVTVWNKLDVPGARPAPFAIPVSAKTGDGIDRIEAEVRLRSHPESGVFLLRIPYTRGAAIASARALFRVVEEKDEGDGLLLSVAGDRRDLDSFAEYAAGAARLPRAARAPRKTKGGADRLPPAPELPRRRSN
jgi:GTP-binding protein HflX